MYKKEIDYYGLFINLQSNSNLAVLQNSAVPFFYRFSRYIQHVSKVLKEWKEHPLSSLLPLSVKRVLKRIKSPISVQIRAVKFIVYSAFLRHAPIYAAFFLAREFRKENPEKRRFCASLYPRKLVCRLVIVPSRPRIPSTNTMSTSFSQRDININVLRKVYSNDACLRDALVAVWRMFSRRGNALHGRYHSYRNFR